MINNVINLLEYIDTNKKTIDGKTQKWLWNKINTIVHKVNTTNDTDEEITEFIKKSFSINGLIESYNRLGFAGWYNMILQMAEHEVWERNSRANRI